MTVMSSMWLPNLRRRSYFLHIPKTAGTTMGAVLFRRYPQSEILNCPTAHLLQMPPEEINARRAFAGHWGTELLSMLDRPIDCLTVVRDPFERTISGDPLRPASGSPEAAP